MKILVCGDREWTDYMAIKRVLAQLPKRTVVIHGNCRGADKLAGEAAYMLGLTVISFPADWKRLGRRAGPIRNAQMLAQGPKKVIAFHSNIKNSKGTKDMMRKAEAVGIKVELHT